MKQLKLAIFALFLCSWAAFGQNMSRSLDSLRARLTTAPNDSARASILTNMATICMDNGNFPKAIELLLKSNSIYASIKNEYGLFDSANRLGVVYCHTQSYNEALRWLLSVDAKIDSGRVYDNLSLVYFNQNKISKSLECLKKSLISYKSDNPRILGLLNDIGSMYEIKNENDSARLYYESSLKKSEQAGDKLNTLLALASIGDLNFKLGRNYTALQYEKKSLELAQKNNALISVRETQKMLSDIYFKIGDYKSSIIFYKKYISTRDALINEDNTKKIIRSEEKFKFEKEKEILTIEQNKKDIIEREKLSSQKNQRNIFIGAFVIVLCLSAFLFRLFKKNQKAKIIITKQKAIVDEQKKDIIDSITYASRIQRAILPPDDLIKGILSEHFMYFAPRDIISGDFYFVDKIGDKIIWASGDATGHSANGCLLGCLALNILTEIIKEAEIVPSKILDRLNERFNKSLHKIDDNSVRDGLDITICVLDTITMELNFSGANQPLWLIRDKIINEYKTDRMAIGSMDKKQLYTNHTIKLEKDDVIYSFSDGIPDLHNEDNKKFMKKRLRELLLSIQGKSMVEQKQIISNTFDAFKGNAQQVDDMLLIGVKI